MSIAALVSSILDDVASDADIGEAVQTATITRAGADRTYNPATGQYEGSTPETITGRVAFDTVKATDILPEGTGGPGDMVLYLFEATGIPREGETIVCAGRSYTIVSTPADEVGLGGVMLKMIVRRV